MMEPPTADRCDVCDGRKAVVNIDGENLCQKHADERVKESKGK